MKYIVSIAVTVVTLAIGLISSTSASVFESGVFSTAVEEADVAVVFRTNVEISSSETQHKQEAILTKEFVRSPNCRPAQLENMSNIFAQMGLTCITPRGTCGLSSPAPINSSCCCPSACGYVGR
jgi:hypothetical protein